MNLKPLSDHLVVRRDTAEDKTPGGIILPDQAKSKPLRGKVLAVGPGRPNDDGGFNAMSVKEGDHVIFTTYGGNEISWQGEKLLILSESDILAIEE